MRTLNFLILLLFSLTSFAKNDSIPDKGNYHCGIFIESKRLISNNYGRFKFKSAGIQLGYRSISFHIALNTFKKEDFQSDNYLIGDREKRKRPFGGLNAGFTIVPYYHSKKYVKIIYKFDYYTTKVYVGTRTTHEFAPGLAGNRTYNFDDRFTSLLAGGGLQINYKDIIAIQGTIQLGINYQSINNSHFMKDEYDYEFISYRKTHNALMFGLSLHYKIHSNVKK